MKIIIILFCIFLCIYSFNHFYKIIFNDLIDDQILKRVKRSDYKNYHNPMKSCFCKMKNLSSDYFKHNKINFICNCDKNLNKHKTTFRNYKPVESSRSNRISYLRYHQALNRNNKNIDIYLRKKRKKKRYRSLNVNDKNLKKNKFKFDCSCDNKGCKGINCNDIKGCVCNENNKCWGNTCESIMFNHLKILKNSNSFLQNLNNDKFKPISFDFKNINDFDKQNFLMDFNNHKHLNDFNNQKYLNEFSKQKYLNEFDNSKYLNNLKFYNDFYNQKLFNNLENQKIFPNFNEKFIDNFDLTEKFYKTYDSLSNFPRKNFFKDNNERFGSESKINIFDTNRLFNSQDLLNSIIKKKSLRSNDLKKTITFKNLILKEIDETFENNENGLCNCFKGKCKGIECNNLNGCICDSQGCKGKYCKLIKNFYEHLYEKKNEENLNKFTHFSNYDKEDEIMINKLPNKIFSHSVNNDFRNQHEILPKKQYLNNFYSDTIDKYKNNEVYVPEQKNYSNEQKNYDLDAKNYLSEQKNYNSGAKNYSNEVKINQEKKTNNQEPKNYIQEPNNTNVISCEKNEKKTEKNFNSKPKLNNDNNLTVKKEEDRDRELKTYEMKVIKLQPIANSLNDSTELKSESD